MNLNELSFFIFFGITFLIIRWSGAFAPFILLVSSYIFYASWNIAYVPILLATTIVDFACARQISANTSTNARRFFLFLSIAFNFLLLFYFKYLFQVIGIFASELDLGGDFKAPLIPIGLSFHTFQSVGYVIDVYLKKYPVEKSFINQANFISFFPQLIAGPIERGSQLLPQLNPHGGYRASKSQIVRGSYLVFLGLFMSLGLAENLAPFSVNMSEGLVDNAFIMGHQPVQLDFIFSFYVYPFTLYLRFAGYSYLAMGFALFLGIELSSNFKYPFFSASMPEFWSRWHISLSRWIRDYVFFPMSQRVRTDFGLYGCIFLTTLLFGVWHEASIGWLLAAMLLASYSVFGHLYFQRRHQFSVVQRVFWSIVTLHVFCLAMFFVNNLRGGQSISGLVYSLGRIDKLDLGRNVEMHHLQIIKYISFAVLIDAVNFVKKDICGILQVRPFLQIALLSLMTLFLFFNYSKESGLSMYFRM
jgi:alginate O-acetyltransferase complex protein AlgI